MNWEDGFESGPFREVAPDILTMPFMTPGLCAQICTAGERRKTEFAPYGPDVRNNAAPGQEMRLNILDSSACPVFKRVVETVVHPILRVYWWPLKPGPIRMPFVIRYDPSVQADLAPHHDAAQVSMAVRLCDGFAGGELKFPRQDWSARDVPVGHAVIWPSRVSHVHLVTPVTGGVRYGLTCWLDTPNSEPSDPL